MASHHQIIHEFRDAGNLKFHAKFLLLKILKSNPNFKKCCDLIENPAKTLSALLDCPFGSFGLPSFACSCSIMQATFPISLCPCSPNTGSLRTLVCHGTHSTPILHILHSFYPYSTLYPILHCFNSSAQHRVTDSTSQHFNFRFPEGRMWLLALVLSTVVGESQLGSFSWPLGTWGMAGFNG